MKCIRCGKHFDEEMYSGICPKCGYFHSRQTEYDVSKYFSAKFGDEVKTSTSAQAAKQHAELHRMYDRHDMHKPHAQQGMPYQAQAANPYQQRGAQAKANPYQQTAGPGNVYHAGRNGGGGSGQQGNYPQYQYGQARADGGAKEKNIVVPICAVIAALSIIMTVVACNIKRISLTESYSTLDYEQEYAGAGEVFEINGRMLIVEKAETVDTSMLDDIPAHIPRGEKLVAVTVGVLPTEEWDRSFTSGMVYLSDGDTCNQYLDSYTLGDILIKESSGGESSYYVTDDILEELYAAGEYAGEEILTGYNYLDYSSAEGKNGKFYFLAGKDAGTVTISFDQAKEKNGVSILEKRVSVPLALEEEMP